ncbi:MAG: cobyric acid synthase CobQ [Omnitrophica WOR_2 bacterium RIFCSPHIGHO2_01_FULL_49_10]|nr:MAG: cobyric acid synthase CobQ [Omnitrophica WOR_2 bacterium RIFCSPHIGHO2_01_FULL_49_10]
MAAKAIQICGTGSGVGKSVIVAGLCRIFLQDGFKVAPFKAQNMSLNSFVTHEGGEIGRAQAMQAAACRLKPSVDMNPILLKPTSDTGSQVILRGKPVGNMSAVEYKDYKNRARAEVLRSFDRLKKDFEIVVIEGAGSPAEVNLKSHDIVNMKMAEAADAPVILVGDIDRGGVFAWLIGTLDLLTKREQKMVKGFIINKFRGDKRLLKSGIDFLKKRTGTEVLGVIPYFKDIKIPEEDSVALEERRPATGEWRQGTKKIDIAVVKLPYTSNFTDFDALENEVDVRLRYISDKDELKGANVIIIPGTKNTIKDLIWLRKSGLAAKILSAFNSKPQAVLIGICGGYQMLGRVIYDSGRIESTLTEIEGLGLLPIGTTFKPEKVLSQTKAVEIDTGIELEGYEIHHGRTIDLETCDPVFKIRDQKRIDGTKIENGRIWGTYLHGIFDNTVFRRNFLNKARKGIGLGPLPAGSNRFNLEDEFDKLAKLVRNNIDMKLLYKILDHRP